VRIVIFVVKFAALWREISFVIFLLDLVATVERESRPSIFHLRGFVVQIAALCREISFCVGRPARLPDVGCRRETLACGKQGRLPYTLC